MASGHTDDFGGPMGREAVYWSDADLDLGGLVVGVFCGNAFSECLEVVSLRLDPTWRKLDCGAR